MQQARSLAPPHLHMAQAVSCYWRREACMRGVVWPHQLQAARPCAVTRAAPKYNPQNVSDPQVLPQLGFSADEAVRVQLDALLSDDDPWPNHGLQTMYQFGEDIGGMERSRYFGFSKDLYHLDHFMGQFQNAFPELVNADSYELRGSSTNSRGDVVTVHVTTYQRGASTGHEFSFLMKQKDMGRKKGCWMTKSIKKIN